MKCNILTQLLGYQRRLRLGLVPIEMALRWAIKLPIDNALTFPAILLLCLKFTTQEVDKTQEAVLGSGKPFAREQWRVFGIMNYHVANLRRCKLRHEGLTPRKEKLVVFNLLCGVSRPASLMARQAAASAAGELVALSRRCA